MLRSAHDRDLKKRLVEESREAGSGFEISGFSETTEPTDSWRDRARRRIEEADELIVICGQDTQDSKQVAAEIGIAQEQGKPYFLLWGRREAMCTKPSGARSGEAMYSWTPSIVRSQVAMTLRIAKATRELLPARFKKP